VQIHEILAFIQKWLWLLLLACLFGGGAGFVVDRFQPKVYEADTTLFIDSPGHSDNSSVLGGQQLASAFVSFPSSTPVLKAALQGLGDNSLSVEQLATMVTVNNARDTQYIVISVRDKDPLRATNLATAIANQSIAQFQLAANDASRAQFKKIELDRIETEIKNLEVELANVQADPHPDPVTQADHISRLSTALATLQGAYAQLLNSYEGDVQIDVVNPAVEPSVPIGSGPKFAVAIGVLAGLIVIIGIIMLVEQSDPILRNPAKVKRVTELPVLLTVGYLPAIAKQTAWLNGYHEISNQDVEQVSAVAKGGSSATYQQNATKRSDDSHPGLALLEGSSSDDTAVTDTLKLQAIQARTSRTATVKRQAVKAKRKDDKRVRKTQRRPAKGFQLYGGFLALGVSLRREGIKSLLVTSAEQGEGKTAIASQIALGLARVGVEVILVDGNLQNPAIHTVFGLSNNIGLSTFLNTSNQTGNINDISSLKLQTVHEPHLSVLSGGPSVSSSMEQLSSDTMADMLQELKQQAVVVIDCPAVLTASEALILADKSDGIVMVVDARSTSAAALNRSFDVLTMVNPNVLGIVLNRADELKGSAWKD
jgi:protein-tyrosine kinase